jgi:hypothetical protein
MRRKTPFTDRQPLNSSVLPPSISAAEKTNRNLEDPMKTVLSIWIAALLFLTACVNTQNMTPEEREAIRKSNERYERERGP